MEKKHSMTGKLVLIGSIIALMLIANLLIGLKLGDRKEASRSAADEISAGAGGHFHVGDVYIVVPYVHHFKNSYGKIESNEGEYKIHANVMKYYAEINTEERSLGIYSSPVFTGQLHIEGEFLCNLRNDSDYTFNFSKAIMLVKLNDKSMVEAPVFFINGTECPVEFCYPDEYASIERNRGIYSEFKYIEGTNTFSTILKIRGAQAFTTRVAGNQTSLKIKSDWKSPGFSGYSYLPATRTISDDGFEAEWFIPFSTATSANEIGFSFMNPVNVYKMLERAITYGFLFIAVPFLVLFLFEVFNGIDLHPLNYLLCGAASMVFFLLLMSFSEHISFPVAYGISAASSGILISLYVASITRKIQSGLQMSLVFLLMYGYLFFSLKSEDYAMLIGSIFAFIVIAVFMFFTRKLRWQNHGQYAEKSNLQTIDKTE